MGASAYTKLAEFGCSRCSVALGWTTEKESASIGKRARVYCSVCKDLPAPPTARQIIVLDALADAALAHGRVTVAELAEPLGLSYSRPSQILNALRAKGYESYVAAAYRGERPWRSEPTEALTRVPQRTTSWVAAASTTAPTYVTNVYATAPVPGEPSPGSVGEPEEQSVEVASTPGAGNARNPEVFNPGSTGTEML